MPARKSGYGRVTVAPVPTQFAVEPVHDSYGRRINYLRISLTDVCNLRCVYCMPEQMQFRPRAELMSDEEILYLVKVAASLGVDKIRLTGGEPTVRPGVVDLIREIAAVPGIRDLAMTTNGLLLDKMAQDLAAAGLKRVNISIDTLDADKFHRITRWGHLDDVWRGIRAAEAHGLLLHVFDEIESTNPFRKARKVLYIRGQRELSAGFIALEHQRFEVGPGGVDGSRMTGTARPGDEHVDVF